MKSEMKVLIIIPAYNEENSLMKLIGEIRSVGIKNAAIDILVVNDCSEDGTSPAAKSLGVKLIDLPVNLGIGGAVQTGYIYARDYGYDMAVQVDGDGQHDPAFLHSLLRPLLEGRADMAIGSRFISGEGFQSSRMRRAGIRLLNGLIFIITGERFTDPTSGFRACSAGVIGFFARHYPVDYPEPASLVSIRRSKFRVAEVPVVMRGRNGGVSSIRYMNTVYYMLKVSLAIILDRFRGR